MPAGPRQMLRSGAGTPGLAALVLVVAGCLVVGFEARSSSFTGDEWEFLLDRRSSDADAFLRPHGEHLSAIPILAFKLLLEVFGAESYAPFIALAIVVHGLTCLLLYALARPLVGPWAALAPTAVLVVLGPAWHNLLWAFQISYLGSTAAGLGMVLCLQRRDRLGDVLAAALLAVSLLCSSIGLGFVVFGAVLLVLQRPRDLRRLWVIGVPLALYAAWYARYGYSTAELDNLRHVPSYVARALAAALASASGLTLLDTDPSPYLVPAGYGWFVGLALIGLLVWHLRRGGRVPALAWGASATAVALWTAACLSNTEGDRAPNSSRYQYVAVALVLLTAAALAKGWRPTRYTGAVLAYATLFACAANVHMLHQRAGSWSEISAYATAETGAMEVARDSIAPSFVPEDPLTIAAIGNHNTSEISARSYFSFVDAFGSAADRPQEILERPEEVRQAADLVLARAERVRSQRVETVSSRGAACWSLRMGSDPRERAVGPGRVSVELEPGGLVAVQLRRFASRYRFVSFGLLGGTSLSVQLPRDRARIPWHIRLRGAGRARVCFAAAP